MTSGDHSREGPAAQPPSTSRKELARTILRALLGVAMVVVGVLHFLAPDGFVRIVPAWLPAPLALVYVSGAAEIAGGIGLFLPRLRRAASWGLIALYIAVFPANVNMALHNLPLGDSPVSPVMLWVRLPLQLVFIALAYWVGKDGRDRAAENR